MRDAARSLLSLVLALTSALLTGAFLGFSTNPDVTAAFDAANMEMARSGFSGTQEEIEKRHLELAQKQPGFNSPKPHTTIAILKWHPFLLGLFSLGFLCVFRPSMQWIAVVFLPAAVVTYLVISLTASLTLLGALVLALMWSAIYARIRKKVAP